MQREFSRFKFCLKIVFVFVFAIVSVACTASAQVKNSSDAAEMTAAGKINVATPSETVRAIYTAMREQRFREAFMMTNWRAAVESLTAGEIEDLREDFVEPLAAQVAGIEISGEQISGDLATVFLKSTAATGEVKNDKLDLRREAGAWLVVMGDKQTEETVRREGKNYFFNLQIEMRHADAQAVLQEIIKAEFVHGLQKGGAFADLPTLVSEKLLSPDVLTAVTGYQFRLKMSDGGKKFTVNAEPAQYGKTGKLSFLLESAAGKNGGSRIRSEDKKGQPLNS